MSFLCHIHNYTEYNEEWNVFSAFNPSKCTHTWSSGQPTLRCPGNSWGFGALPKGLTSVVDTSCQSRDSNPQPTTHYLGFQSNTLDCKISNASYFVSHVLTDSSSVAMWREIVSAEVLCVLCEHDSRLTCTTTDSVFSKWMRTVKCKLRMLYKPEIIKYVK